MIYRNDENGWQNWLHLPETNDLIRTNNICQNQQYLFTLVFNDGKHYWQGLQSLGHLISFFLGSGPKGAMFCRMHVIFCPSVHTSVCPSVRTPLAQAPRPRPPGPSPPAQAPQPRPHKPQPPAFYRTSPLWGPPCPGFPAQAPRPRPLSPGLLA